MSEMLNMKIFFKKEFKLPTGRYVHAAGRVAALASLWDSVSSPYYSLTTVLKNVELAMLWTNYQQ